MGMFTLFAKLYTVKIYVLFSVSYFNKMLALTNIGENLFCKQ